VIVMKHFKRRQTQKTDYRQRLALLRSGKPRMVVRKGNNSIHVQIIEYTESGDKVVMEVSSSALKKFGWLGHNANTPAAYLTGYLIGTRAAGSIKEAILDIGLQTSVKGVSLYAVVLGAKDAGLSIPIGKEILPSKERIRGDHVSAFATKLKKDSPEKYKKQFSAYLKSNLMPEKLPEHFEEVKKKIGVEKKIAVATNGGK
jgi:large subunit ribosomal protein L18